MTDKTEFEVLTVDLPRETESRRYEFRESRRLHDGFAYPRQSSPRIPRQRHGGSVAGAVGTALGISVAGAAIGVLSAWSIDGLVSLMGGVMGDALRMVSSAVWHFKG